MATALNLALGGHHFLSYICGPWALLGWTVFAARTPQNIIFPVSGRSADDKLPAADGMNGEKGAGDSDAHYLVFGQYRLRATC